MFRGQRVLITGPTSGIGKDLAEIFAAEGAELILVSRSAGRLGDLKRDLEKRFGVRCHSLAVDLAQPGSAETLLWILKDKGLSVDILVNNAGYGVYGNFADAPIEPQLGMIQIHVTVPTQLAHALLGEMRRKRSGGILNVASTGAFQPVPIENVYCSTKAYLLHFTEALAEELRGSGVRVTCLCPGPTETPFFDTPLMKSTHPPKLSRMDSRTVARMGIEGFKKGKPLVITGLRNHLMVLATRLGPRKLVTRIAKKIVEKKSRKI